MIQTKLNFAECHTKLYSRTNHIRLLLTLRARKPLYLSLVEKQNGNIHFNGKFINAFYLG